MGSISRVMRATRSRRSERKCQEEHAGQSSETSTSYAHRLFTFIFGPFSTTSPQVNVLQVICGLIVLCGTVIDIEMYSPYSAGQGIRTARLIFCPSRFTCGDLNSPVQIMLLVVSRFSAGAMYAVLLMITMTTAHSFVTWLGRRARIRLNGGLLGGSQLSKVHMRAGVVFARLCVLHGVAHTLRWALRNEIPEVVNVFMVCCGFISAIAFCLVHPILTSVKHMFNIPFEITMKLGHHAVITVGLISGILHHWRLLLVVLILTVVWTLDRVHLLMFRSYVIEKPHLTACRRSKHSPGGVLVTFRSPKGFAYETGDYVKISFPWLPNEKLKHQWHPFSIAPVSIGNHLKTKLMLYLQVEGDWTEHVHECVMRTGNGYSRPLILCGPFASPFNASIMHDYLFLVASGIGITPSLSVLARLGKYRHICVLWMSRDAELIKLYSEYVNPANGICTEAVVHLTSARNEADATRLTNEVAPVTVKHGRPNIKALARQLLTGGTGSFSLELSPLDAESPCEDLFSGDATMPAEADGMEMAITRVDMSLPSPPRRPRESRRYTCSPGVMPTYTGLPNSANCGTPKRVTREGFVPLETRKTPLPKLTAEHCNTTRCVHQEPITACEWKVLYCGGSKTILKLLSGICKETGAAFESEVF